MQIKEAANKQSNEFRETQFDRMPDAQILIITGEAEGFKKPIGSGIIIGPGIAVTAWHVIEEFYKVFCDNEVQFTDRWHYRGNPRLFRNPRFTICAHLFDYSDPEPVVIRFNVESLDASGFSDLVLLKLQPEPKHLCFKYRYRAMQAMPPVAGSYVEAFGYRCEEEGRIKRILPVALGSRGQVLNVFSKGSDHNLYYSPGFQTNAIFAGGMSGGPVYTLNGRLCGIVCADRGGSTHNSDAQSVSYASAIFPLLACQIELSLHGEPSNTRFSVQQLCRRGILSMRGQSWFNLTFDLDGHCSEIVAPSLSGRRGEFR